MDKELEQKLLSIINDAKFYNNNELITFVCDGFSRKGLNRSIPTKLFSDLMTIDELSRDELNLIWITKSLYEFGKENNIKELIELNPHDYFSDLKMKSAYEKSNKEKSIKKLVFNNVTKIGDFQFVVPFVSVNDLYEFKKSELISYDFETQREGKSRLVGDKGTIVKEITINQQSVEAISNLIYEDKFTSNMISLCVPLLDNNDESTHMKYYEDTKQLVIEPEYSEEGHLCYVNILDGFHRYMSAYEAVKRAKENGKTLHGGFIISINLFTNEEAKAYFLRENTVNEIGKEYLKTFNDSSENKFIKALSNHNSKEQNIFKENVSKTFEEHKATKSLTYYSVLESVLKYTNIDIKNIKSLKFDMPKIAEFTTKLIESLLNKTNYGIEELREYTPLLDSGIFAAYIKMTDNISSDELEMDTQIDYISNELLKEQNINKLKEMKLNNKSFNITDLIKFADTIVEGVMK